MSLQFHVSASAKVAVLERHGFTLQGYVSLPETCWLDAYDGPLRARFAAFLETPGHSEGAWALVTAEEAEIDLYERHRRHVSYVFYVARKVEA